MCKLLCFPFFLLIKSTPSFTETWHISHDGDGIGDLCDDDDDGDGVNDDVDTCPWC